MKANKEAEKKLGKTFTGVIVSVKSQNTVVVKVERKIIHPLYKKVLKRNKKYKVDSALQDLSIGDKVIIVETRPISKDKHFRIFVNDKRKVERKIKNGSA